MKNIRLCLIIFVFLSVKLYAQVEHVPVVHPVYSFLLHAETKGYLPHYSLSSLPLQRMEIVEALKLIRQNANDLNSNELETLEDFESEFELLPRENAVIFYSSSDSIEVLSPKFFSNDEKFFYHYKDTSGTTVNVVPLGSVEYVYSKGNEKKDVILGNLGVRFHGTVTNLLGYYLQATNGTVIAGDRSLAFEDSRIAHNVKFAYYNSDFDFTESHVRLQYDWFYAIIGRETRLVGAGLAQRLFMSSNATPSDALSLGARFSNFEYRFTHGSLLALPDSSSETGVGARIPAKYMATHRFALKPSWGEIAFWEGIIYSGRDIDLAYLNPLSFMKSLEHALHDRDNSMMGGDLTLRPLAGLQLKASYLLDDVVFSEIGKSYWSNKSAWNAAVIASLPGAIDLGIEYSRIEPYTFSHFNQQNSVTSDSLIVGSYLLPNSDETSILMQWWWGGRYPLEARLSYMRHGKNIYDSNGNLIKNVGGDPLQVRRSEDPFTVTFLDGEREDIFSASIQSGWEIIRGFNLHGIYTYRNIDGVSYNSIRVLFRFEDF